MLIGLVGGRGGGGKRGFHLKSFISITKGRKGVKVYIF